MNKLAAFAIGIILVAGVISTAKADTIYFDDGTLYELRPGESVYISSGRVWEFTRFDPLDLRIQALEPLVGVHQRFDGQVDRLDPIPLGGEGLGHGEQVGLPPEVEVELAPSLGPPSVDQGFARVGRLALLP